MATSAEDDDTLQGFVAHFTNNPGLFANFPSGVRTGRQTTAPIVGGVPQLYAVVFSKKGSTPNQYMAPAITGTGYHDFRHVTINVHGLYADVIRVMPFIRSAFEWQPYKTPSISIPNAKLIAVRPIASEDDEEESTKASQDIWKGVAEYEVETSRTIP